MLHGIGDDILSITGLLQGTLKPLFLFLFVCFFMQCKSVNHIYYIILNSVYFIQELND